MDADPPPTPPAKPEEPRASSPKFILPKQKRRHRKPEDGDGEEDREEDEAAALLNSALQRFLQRKKDDGEKERPARATINRFLPRAEPAPAVPAVVPPAPAVSTDGNTRTTDPASTAFPKFRPRTAAGGPAFAGTGGEHPWRRRLLYGALAAVLVLAAFFAGRRSATPDAPPPPRAIAQSELWQLAFSDPLEKALAADHAGNVAAALQIIDSLADRVKESPALQAYRATLNTRLGDTGRAETDLSRRLRAGVTPDATYLLNTARAFNFARRRQFDQALPCYAAVARVQPFDVANLIHWAETLRRKGDFTDAIDMFQAASARLPATAAPYVDAQREYIAYEQRLCRIESGHAAEVRAELDPHLRAPAPSGYWLMTAAALALQNTDMPGATDALNKARAVFAPGGFDALISDYFFRSFAYRAEMNGFAVVPASDRPQTRQSSMDYFLDP